MRKSFAEVEHAGGMTDYNGIRSGDSYAMVARKVFEASIGALRDTQGLISDSQYEKAVGALLSARKILICGVGDAHLVALEAHQRFVRSGRTARCRKIPTCS